MMPKVAPTAALFLKKPEEESEPVAAAAMVRVEPVVVEANPEVWEFGVLTNVVVGLFAMLDTAPTEELTKCQPLYNDTYKGSGHTW
jgi:hypothetical protein